MPAYLIAIREEPVRDPEAMAEYQRLNREEGPEGFSLKPLIVYGAMECMEGKPADGVIVVEFPTKEEAHNWYNSPAYQAAIPHRQKAADYRVMIVDGL